MLFYAPRSDCLMMGSEMILGFSTTSAALYVSSTSLPSSFLPSFLSPTLTVISSIRRPFDVCEDHATRHDQRLSGPNPLSLRAAATRCSASIQDGGRSAEASQVHSKQDGLSDMPREESQVRRSEAYMYSMRSRPTRVHLASSETGGHQDMRHHRERRQPVVHYELAFRLGASYAAD